MRALSRFRSGLVLVGLMALAVAAPLESATAAKHTPKTRAVRVTSAPEKDAALVMDGATGKVLYARNPDAIRYPASLTKMMTLYLLFEAIDKGRIALHTPMNTSTHASSQSPTKLGLRPGDSVPVETAIKALTVLSANDVAVVIAETLGGGNETFFASLMTEKAHELGMSQTNFHNASGLPDLQQLTTARDMAILARHLAYDFPQYYHYFSTPSFSFNGRTYNTHDNLLAAFKGTDGIKTGYTQLSGFNLVSSVVRDNKHVVGVVMGGNTAASRDREMMRILSATFDYAANDPAVLADANVPWQGGTGPGGDVFAAQPNDENVLAAMLDLPPKTPAATKVASAAPAPKARAARPVMPTPRPNEQIASLTSSSTFNASSADSLGQGDFADAFPLPVPRPDVDTVKQWVVQIGAYASHALAEAQLSAYSRRALNVFGEAQRLVIPLSLRNGHTLYRARFGLFAESEAREICRQMTSRGEPCLAALQAN
jgi:D-alanyl-D-alanine carboxypeptidase